MARRWILATLVVLSGMVGANVLYLRPDLGRGLVKGQDHPDSTEIHLETGFDGSSPITARQTGKNRFAVMLPRNTVSDLGYPSHMYYWFYFKVSGVKDQSLTIDILNCEWMPSHWDTYKPVYTYAADPNDLSSHDWRTIENTYRIGSRFSFTQRFTADSVFIALRYPYTYTYLERYLKAIQDNPNVVVASAGSSEEGRNIWTVTITDKSLPDPGKKGIWLVAKEHGCEQDGAWVIEGVMQFLLSEDSKAALLRRRTIFVLVPIAAPDAAYRGSAVNPASGYNISHRYSTENPSAGGPSGMSAENRAIWSKAESFTQRGVNIDIAASFHNVHGGEENVWSMYSTRYKLLEHRSFNEKVFAHLGPFTRNTSELPVPLSPFLFPGRCGLEFGTVGFAYEFNQHASGSPLSLQDLHKIGEAFAMAVLDYFAFSND